MAPRILAAVFPAPEDPAHFDASSSIQEVASQAKDGAEVRVLAAPDFAEFKAAVSEFKPTLLYVCGATSYAENKVHGTIGPVVFKDGPQSADALAAACTGVETVYMDAAVEANFGPKLQACGVHHVITWPETSPVPAVVAAQFSHTLFTGLLSCKCTVHEAFALANHAVQAHCTTLVEAQYYSPALPSLFSAQKASLPDNSSITVPSIPGLDVSQGLAAAVPGWSDIRLLAPRAELRLLLTGGPQLVDGTKLSFLGEALRALLVMETRSLTLVSTTPCQKVPANLPAGCAAVRCEVKTSSGAVVAVVLGGQPAVLQDAKLVEHALRMTLVADSLSLQFRLPPPGLAQPVARTSAAIAGNTPVVDALVLTSVWAVHVLRTLSQSESYKPLISLGIAAIGGTATVGVSALDAQRLKIIVSGMGPAAHPLVPIQTPSGNVTELMAGDAPAAGL